MITKRTFLCIGMMCLPLSVAVAPANAQPPAILQPVNGAITSSPVKILIDPGTQPAAAAPMAGMQPASATHMGAHIHLIIDAPLPPPGTPIPMDKHHVHLLHGETSKTLQLAPGTHHIQLVVGNVAHQSSGPQSYSKPVEFTVR